MKKEVVGTILLIEKSNDWIFETEDSTYIEDVPEAIDQLFGDIACNGDKFRITIEKLN
jgi:hypothetical protein